MAGRLGGTSFPKWSLIILLIGETKDSFPNLASLEDLFVPLFGWTVLRVVFGVFCSEVALSCPPGGGRDVEEP